MPEDDWGHRTEMESHETTRSRGVSEAVNERQAGPVSIPQPRNEPDDEDDEHPHYDGEQYADKWEAKFSHLPGVGDA